MKDPINTKLPSLSAKKLIDAVREVAKKKSDKHRSEGIYKFEKYALICSVIFFILTLFLIGLVTVCLVELDSVRCVGRLTTALFLISALAIVVADAVASFIGAKREKFDLVGYVSNSIDIERDENEQLQKELSLDTFQLINLRELKYHIEHMISDLKSRNQFMVISALLFGSIAAIFDNLGSKDLEFKSTTLFFSSFIAFTGLVGSVSFRLNQPIFHRALLLLTLAIEKREFSTVSK